MDEIADKQSIPRPRKPAPIGQRIANAMQRLGVQGIPRNYELFYDALTGTNAELNSDFWGLGCEVSQERLDELYAKHYGNRDGHAVVERVRAVLDEKIRHIIEVLKDEQNSMPELGDRSEKGGRGAHESENGIPDKLRPVIDTLVRATGSTLNDAQQPLASMIENLNELESLKSALDEYKHLAETDPLTGVWNRRAFDDRLAKVGTAELENAALLIIDIDHFKQVNDSYGHPFGDAVIRDVARLIRFNMRDDAAVARTGGEEFAVLLPQADPAAALRIARRLREAVERSGFRHAGLEVPAGRIAVSVGVSSMPPASSGADLYMKADQALYASKNLGRNRVTLFDANFKNAAKAENSLHAVANWL